MKKGLIILIVVIFSFALIMLFKINSKEGKKEDMVNEIKLRVNDEELIIDLENNSSSKALVEMLKKGDIKVKAHDYGNFEKVGSLGFELPTNDKNITVHAGDVILYQGNQITVYYDTNTWSFTKLGKIKGVSKDELKKILKKEEVTLRFSLK